MTDRKDIIWKFQNTIIEIYKEQELTSLKGLNNEFDLNGRQILSWYSDATRKGKCKYFKDFDFNKNFDDLIFCSDEILYFLANMYLYLPYLNNPIKDGFPFGDEIIYPNIQNLEAKRYSMLANIISEKFYNYWDRIGDLLAAYFPDLLKPHQVFFAKIIDIMPEEYHENENYKWLENFKANEFKELNQKRKQIVHYTTEDTAFKYTHLENTSNKENMEALIEERDSLADYYKKHMELTFKGFEKTLLLIENITEDTLSDIE